MEISKKVLVEEYLRALLSGSAGIFAGSGLSRESGYVDWMELLRKPAEEIHLNVEKERHNLVGLAQYYKNSCNSRGRLNQIIVEEFGSNAMPTKNHTILAKLPIDTFWTTNYDCLIENALRQEGKKADVKIKDRHLQIAKPNTDALVYKMHGDVNDVDEAIITREDYDRYNKTHPLFREVLDGNLLTKTFLFLGFSFTDPNLNYVFGRMCVLLGENTRPHYCILRRVSKKEFTDSEGVFNEEDFSYAQVKQTLQIEDLAKYGIRACLIDEYAEITNILDSILKKVRRRTIFISGSAESYSPFSKDQAGSFIHNLSFKLAERGYCLVTGFGKGVGSYIINGVLEYQYRKSDEKLDRFLKIMPFPQMLSGTSPTLEIKKKYRSEMIEDAGISLFIFGNKLEKDLLIPASGMREEYDIALQSGSVPLPIKCTGSISSELYTETYLNRNNISQEANFEKALIACGKEIVGDIKEKDLDDIIENIIYAVNIINEFA